MSAAYTCSFVLHSCTFSYMLHSSTFPIYPIYILLVCVALLALFACWLLQLMAMLVRNNFVSLCFLVTDHLINDMETANKSPSLRGALRYYWCPIALIVMAGSTNTPSIEYNRANDERGGLLLHGRMVYWNAGVLTLSLAPEKIELADYNMEGPVSRSCF
jgi:hypothetical protein